ncbi:MAG: hypothetical protein WC503_00735 [Candidatus Shapirobacteria bacterium]
MSRISVKNLLPSSGRFDGVYRGVVEDNNDPEKRGRCKVRIYGIHTQVKTISETEGIPTANLPWAEPCLSIFEGAVSGFGMFSVPLQGSHLYIFFENGALTQPRYFASAPGIPKLKANPKDGFNDPSGNYPLSSMLGESDWNRLARDNSTGTVVETRKARKLENVPDGESGTWSEKDPYYYLNSTKYPNDTILATHAGFVIELDNTPSGERFHLYHPSNSYIEISPTGDMVIRNNADRYNLIIGKSYEYIGGESYRYITGKENEVIGGTKRITITDAETKIVQGKQISYGIGGQTLAAGSTQNISAKASQNVGVWGAQSFSGKGSVSHSCLGFLSSFTAGFRSSSAYGPAAKNSMGPNQSGGTPTLLGKKPITEALNKTNSALAGIQESINKAMQPIMEAMQKFQETIAAYVQDAIGWANEVLKPVTEIVMQVDEIATYIKTEMAAARQLFQTITTAPQLLIGTIANYASTIMNFPGQVGMNILNQVSGIPANLNLLRSLMSIYSSANEIYTSGMTFTTEFTPTIKDQLQQFQSLYDLAFDYSAYTALGDIDLYPRSGIFGIGSFLEGGEAYFGLGGDNINDQYFYTLPASAYTSMATIAGSGGLVTELNEKQSFVTLALSSSFVDGNGDFQMNDLIDYMYEQLAPVIKAKVWARATMNEFEDGFGVIDYDSWVTVGGLIETPLCSGVGYLTADQQENVSTTLLSLPEMDHGLRVILWAYPTSMMKDLYDGGIITEEQYRFFQTTISSSLRTILEAAPASMMKDLYDGGTITEPQYEVFRLPGESDIDFNTRMETTDASTALSEADTSFDAIMAATSALQILTAYVSSIIKIDINILYIKLDEYITEVIRRIKDSLKEMFRLLVEYETQVREIVKYLTVENAEWEGKFDDWEDLDNL